MGGACEGHESQHLTTLFMSATLTEIGVDADLSDASGSL